MRLLIYFLLVFLFCAAISPGADIPPPPGEHRSADRSETMVAENMNGHSLQSSTIIEWYAYVQGTLFKLPDDRIYLKEHEKITIVAHAFDHRHRIKKFEVSAESTSTCKLGDTDIGQTISGLNKPTVCNTAPNPDNSLKEAVMCSLGELQYLQCQKGFRLINGYIHLKASVTNGAGELLVSNLQISNIPPPKKCSPPCSPGYECRNGQCIFKNSHDCPPGMVWCTKLDEPACMRRQLCEKINDSLMARDSAATK